MWITVQDKRQEYVINFENILFFIKTSDCKHEPGIDLVVTQGGINLSYDSEEERDSIYQAIRMRLNTQTKIGL